MLKRALTILLLSLVSLGLVLPAEAAVPSSFEDQLDVDGISSPTAIAWLPNGDLLITSQAGVLYRHETGPGTSADDILDLSNTVCSPDANGPNETGLLGLAVDPDFSAGQRFIYLYYTDRQGNGNCNDASNRANRVSRFPMAVNGTLSLGSEQVLIDNIPARGGNHNGGDLQFGKDGLLYVSVGDSGRDLTTGKSQDGNANARSLSLLNGKILRITPNGDVPASNPFTGRGTTACADAGRAPLSQGSVKVEKKRKAKKKRKRKRKKKRRHKRRQQKRKRRQLRNAPICQEIFATGLRNPYRIAFDPDDGPSNQRFFINDVGGGAWEEIDVGRAGADYGWNIREGPCRTGSTNQCAPDNRFQAPFFAYAHNTGCRTITGGAFVPNDANWPPQYRDTYIYADFICDRLFFIDDQSPGRTPQVFANGISATHLAFGPDNALYYTTFSGGGQVRRILPPS